MNKVISKAAILVVPMLVAGCTIHPRGEDEIRSAARDIQKSFDTAGALPPLAENATVDELVTRSLLTNQGLREKFWQWKSAIEQIPQDGTQPGNLALSAGMDITRGAVGSRAITVGAGNDPMADILLPAKLSVAGKRALENARAAGWRFKKAQFELRAKVLSAYADYALTAELIRLDAANIQLIEMSRGVVEVKNRAGSAGQAELLRITNELEIGRNDLESLQAMLPGQLATLNSLLDRTPFEQLTVPNVIPAAPELHKTDERVLQLAAWANPELSGIASEMAAGRESIALARLGYLPDFSLSAGTDLAGITQSLMGMVTLPLLRYQAINAAVSQAEANLKAKEAARKQMSRDLGAELVADLATIHDLQRQLRLYKETLLPRAEQIVSVTRSSYEAGQVSLVELVEAERSLIGLRHMEVNLRVVILKRFAEVEARVAVRLEE